MNGGLTTTFIISNEFSIFSFPSLFDAVLDRLLQKSDILAQLVPSHNHDPSMRKGVSQEQAKSATRFLQFLSIQPIE
jgi:hypothetical protein